MRQTAWPRTAAALGAPPCSSRPGDDAQLTVPVGGCAGRGRGARAARMRCSSSNSVEGREVAARFAARTRSALAVDAVGVSRDAEGVVAHHSVYGGAYNVDSAVTLGRAVITVRQGAIEARAEAVARPRSKTLAVTASGKPAASDRVGRRGRRGVVSSRAARSREGRLGWSRARLGREVRAGRAARRRAGCRGRRVARRRRCRIRAAVVPGRADRGVGVAAAVRRARDLGRDPAQGRHADGEDDRRDQQGRGCPDLRDRRLRRRRRPVHRSCRS